MALLTKLQNRIAQTREKRERGAVLVLTALVMLLLLFIAAFATDLGAWYRQGQEQQRAADVGALNGIQTYDAAVRDYFEGLGFVDWNSPGLTPPQLQRADELGLIAASNTIIGLFETSGLVFTDQGTPNLADDPTDPTQVSTWTIEATDGTEVIITRSLFQSGLDSMGNPVYERVIDVQVIAPGEQYFSNIIRDAPEIERSASSRLSNCGAVCSTPIELSPPFNGFDAAGNGDGWAPLLQGGQNGDEIWAVNHHSNNQPSTNGIGSIICMNRDTETFCDDFSDPAGNGRVPLDNFRTNTRPTDYLDVARNKIYFITGEGHDINENANTSTTRVQPTSSGLACFDITARDWCGGGADRYLPLWNFTITGNTNAHGPVAYNDKLYSVSHNGQLVCVDPDTMQECAGTSRWTLDVSTNPNIPPLDLAGAANNIELVGSKLLMTFNLRDNAPGASRARQRTVGTAFECVDLATINKTSCWGGHRSTGVTGNGLSGAHNKRFTYLSMNSLGVPQDICLANTKGQSACVAINATNPSVVTSTGGLAGFLDANLNNGWIGDTFAVVSGEQVRTLFGGGESNVTLCWDWKTNAKCDLPGTDGVLQHPTGANLVEPYAYAQVSENCVLGLGDEAVFFTLDVVTLETCTGSQVTTQVEPCDCADGSERYGVLELPDALKVQLDVATGKVTGTTGAVPPLQGDLLAGPLDLSVFNGDPGPLELTIEVQSKVNGTQLVWQDDFAFDLELVVQPTLTN